MSDDKEDTESTHSDEETTDDEEDLYHSSNSSRSLSTHRSLTFGLTQEIKPVAADVLSFKEQFLRGIHLRRKHASETTFNNPSMNHLIAVYLRAHSDEDILTLFLGGGDLHQNGCISVATQSILGRLPLEMSDLHQIAHPSISDFNNWGIYINCQTLSPAFHGNSEGGNIEVATELDASEAVYVESSRGNFSNCNQRGLLFYSLININDNYLLPTQVSPSA